MNKSSTPNISFRKKLGLELFRQYKKAETARHELTYLFWECTLRCNLNCKHCGSDCKKDALQKDMPLQDFLKVIDSITPHVNPNNTMIVLTGGEPLMRNDLDKCGNELYNRGYPWGMVSNGLFLSRQRIFSLINAGLRSITISLDGLEYSHNTMRRHKDSFKNALEAIKIISSIDDLIYDVVTCVTPANFEELNNLKTLLINKGVKQWRIFTVFPIGRASEDESLQLSPIQFKQLFNFIKETREEGKIHLNYGCEGFLGNYESEVRDNFFFCRAGINIGSILNDGSISACPNLRSNFIQGNIYKDNFMDVWNNKYEPHRNRKWTKKGDCKDCSYFRYCEGNGLHLHDENENLLFCHLKRIEEGKNACRNL